MSSSEINPLYNDATRIAAFTWSSKDISTRSNDVLTEIALHGRQYEDYADLSNKYMRLILNKLSSPSEITDPVELISLARELIPYASTDVLKEVQLYNTDALKKVLYEKGPFAERLVDMAIVTLKQRELDKKE